MKREIWKFELLIKDGFEIEMPDPIIPLSVQKQGTGIYLWAIVNPDSEKVTKKFACVGTGHGFELSNKSFIGTVQNGAFVWHFFMVHNY